MSAHPDTMSENANIEDVTSDPKAQGDPSGGSGLGGHLVRPWDWIVANPRKALRMVGVSFREQDEAEDIMVHVVTEDPRYPLMCVNGGVNFGISINAETGMPEGGRGCICAARADDVCICDLGTNALATDRCRERTPETLRRNETRNDYRRHGGQ